MADCSFTAQTFAFLAALPATNRRDGFAAHRQDYEAAVRTPALAFIDARAGELAMISPHFPAAAKKAGGSLMRIHRDTRFGKNKRPYKTNVGIHFRHEAGKDVHAPGYAEDHPLIDDLKRKDFIAVVALDDGRVAAQHFPADVLDYFQRAMPYMRFLCKALKLRF